ncbi:hypothetical protein M378DRAFT_1039922 [Amanita muscaria Koide BX008]|uniref:Uncharacterized protein n=1 Tax=Amanita muscaria (strain Koide BX008) TaxID=946122 RepID=A0A0C2WIS0_AMAMK|nr:hypothetical protein M378DRAFT_1039922 [Amanita muscaria Koide BX008]
MLDSEDLAEEDGIGEIKVRRQVSQRTSQSQGVQENGVRTAFVFDGVWLPPPRHAQAVQGHAGGRKLRPRKKDFSEEMKGIRDGAPGEDRPSPGPDSEYHGGSDSDEDDEEEYTFPDNLQKKRKVGAVRTQPPPLPSKRCKGDPKKSKGNGPPPDVFQSRKRTPRSPEVLPPVPPQERMPAHAVIPSLNNNTLRLPKRQTGFIFLDNHCCDCASVPSRSHKRCKVLTFFGFYYHQELELVICYNHGRGITPDVWLSHVLESHGDLRGQAREKRHILAMINHVAESFRLICSATDLNLPNSISEPILMMLPFDGVRPSIAGRFPCPVSTCGQWVKVSYGKTMSYQHELSKHIKKTHEKSIRDFPGVSKDPLWTQMLMLTPSLYHIFRLPPNWSPSQITPPAVSQIAETTVDPVAQNQDAVIQAQTHASWMKTIGWFKYREAYGNQSFSSLQALIAIPSKQSIARFKGSRQWLENSLHQIFELCFQYLVNAERFIASCHEGVRDAITYKSERGRFRRLTTAKYREYSRVLSQTVAMSMRLLHQKIHSRSSAGTITLLLTGNQLESALNLYTVAMKGRGSSAPELPDVLHKFCATLLKPGDLPSDALACPTDQVLFLRGIQPQGTYASARSVKSTCSALQHCLRSILIHIVRQKYAKLDTFEWYEATKPLKTDVNASNGVGFTEEAPTYPGDYETKTLDQCEDVDDEEVLLEQIMNEVYTYRQDCNTDQRSADNPSSEQVAVENSQSVIPLINKEEPWLTIRPAGGRSTPFSRLHYVWLKVDRYALEETGSMQFNSSGDGHTWSFGRLGVPPKQIDMRTWAMACEAAGTGFREAVLSLAIDADFVEKSMSLMHKIKDEGIRLAPHRQVQNLTWMAPIQSWLRKVVFDQISTIDAEIDLHQANCWLKKEQMALESLANVFLLSTGVSFRGWQLSSIRFDCSESSNRNVWIVDETFIATHPKAKQRNKEFTPTLVAFPKQLFPHISIYLYLIRPVACEVLKALHRDSSCHSSVLWAHSIPSEGHSSQPLTAWSGHDVALCTGKLTKNITGIAITPLLARQVTQAIFRDKFPQLFSDVPTELNVLNELYLYGNRCGFPSWADLPGEAAVKLLAVSQIWQAMLEVEPVVSMWMPLVEGSHIFPSERKENWEVAFLTAYRLLRELHIDSFSSPSPIGVVGQVLFGFNSSRVEIDLPLWGLHAETVARSIQIITIAAADEPFPTLSNPSQTLDALDTQRTYDNAFIYLQGFKRQSIDHWDSFSREVYDLHRCPSLFTASRQERESVACMTSHLAAGRA